MREAFVLLSPKISVFKVRCYGEHDFTSNNKCSDGIIERYHKFTDE